MPVGHAFLHRRTTPPVKYRGTVKIPLVMGIMAAQNNVIEMVKRIGSGNFVSRQNCCAGTKTGLQLLVATQLIGKCLGFGQIHIAKTVQRNIRCGRVVHMMLKTPHHIHGKLRNFNV